MKKHIISLSISIVIMLIGIFYFKEVEKNSLIIEEKNNRLIATQDISQLSTNIQTILNSNMQYVEFFDLLIQNNPNISKETIENYADNILEGNNIVNSISIAPNAIVEYIFPIEGNESAIGHDLLRDPERKEYIQRSIETRKAVSQGPVEAKQGGLKIFKRKAIFTNDKGVEQFWGVVAIVIDFNKLLEKLELFPEKGKYLYSLKVNRTNSNEDFVWGYDEIFNKDAITKNINLSGETWTIAIYPKKGWNNIEVTYQNIKYFLYITSLAIFILVYSCIYHYQQIKEAAKRDPLTGLYNKKYFENYVKKRIKRNNKNHALLLIDLNKFKQINDTLGHPIGDKVLKEASNRIKTRISTRDKLGRIGGDEFILFVPDVKDQKLLFDLIDSIKNEMKVLMKFEEHKIELTCSIGLSISNRDGKTYRDLYRIADKHMYEDKIKDH